MEGTMKSVTYQEVIRELSRRVVVDSRSSGDGTEERLGRCNIVGWGNGLSSSARVRWWGVVVVGHDVRRGSGGEQRRAEERVDRGCIGPRLPDIISGCGVVFAYVIEEDSAGVGAYLCGVIGAGYLSEERAPSVSSVEGKSTQLPTHPDAALLFISVRRWSSPC